MAYCILRITKLTTYGNIAASAKHTYRERPTTNAVPERAQLNRDFRPARSAAAIVASVKSRIALATKKSVKPVLCIEYLISATPEWLAASEAKRDAYMTDALQWLEKKHGPENIVAANLQLDELSPHLVVYVVPLVVTKDKIRKRSVIVGVDADGKKLRENRDFLEKGECKLSATEFIDGTIKLRALQTEFAKEVGKKYGLERGVEGSNARHQSLSRYYNHINSIFKPLPEIITPVPEKLRSEPTRPQGMLASINLGAIRAYEAYHKAWKDEKSLFEKQKNKRSLEKKARYEVAIEMARRGEAQASFSAELEAQIDDLKRSNGYLKSKAQELRDENTKLKSILSLFTGDDIKLAQERRRAEVERGAQQASMAKLIAEEAAKNKITREVQRRTSVLMKMEGKVDGMLSIFVKNALACVRENFNNLALVDWSSIELKTIREVGSDGESITAMVDMLAKYSPYRAYPNAHDELRVAIERTLFDLKSSDISNLSSH